MAVMHSDNFYSNSSGKKIYTQWADNNWKG